MTSTTATPPPVRLPTPATLPGWSRLRVEREDIVFFSPEPGVVQLEVTLHNDGPDPTAPTALLLRSAPLGAFVPWQPLDALLVPPVVPGESAVVEREFRYEAPEPLGGIDKLPPDRVLTAFGLGEPERDRRRRRAIAPSPAGTGLAPDLMSVLQQGSMHWAGNLNLFFPDVDVERHVAQALRIYPAHVNLAMFIIGDHTDEYQFSLTGEADTWNARLFDTDFGRPIVEGLKTPEVQEGRWHAPNAGLLLLAVEPPAGAESGAVNVHVRQRSTNREAVVEFTMDARAAGPGCYKV